MRASDAIDNMITLISQATEPSLQLQREDWKRVNPKWSMVARVFVNSLTNVEVIPRLAKAETLGELKAVLFVDHYLACVKNAHFRRHMQELLADIQVPLEVVETYAALSFAREAIWQAEDQGPIDKREILYSVEAAAEQLGVDSETLYRGIQTGKVNAELYLTRLEIERLTSAGAES